LRYLDFVPKYLSRVSDKVSLISISTISGYSSVTYVRVSPPLPL
jgi:hypothetical protein